MTRPDLVDQNRREFHLGWDFGSTAAAVPLVWPLCLGCSCPLPLFVLALERFPLRGRLVTDLHHHCA